MLEYLADQLERGRMCGERELNGVLRRLHEDVATLRRELVGAKLVLRTTGGVYKLAGRIDPTPAAMMAPRASSL